MGRSNFSKKVKKGLEEVLEYVKYKPCCDKRCMLFDCETREDGGCYCLCRLKDFEETLASLIEEGRIEGKDGIAHAVRLKRVQEEIKKYEN